MDINSLSSGADGIWTYLRIIVIQPAFWIPVGGPGLCNIFLGTLKTSTTDEHGHVKNIFLDPDFQAYFDYVIQYYTVLASFVSFIFLIVGGIIKYSGTQFESILLIVTVITAILGLLCAMGLRFANEKYAMLYKGKSGFLNFPPCRSPMTWIRISIAVVTVIAVIMMVNNPPELAAPAVSFLVWH